MFKVEERIEPGNGMIHLTSQIISTPNSTEEAEMTGIKRIRRIQTNFKILKFSYPLKLISTKPCIVNQILEEDSDSDSDEKLMMMMVKREIQMIYILSYGGGLIIGDLIKLKIVLDDQTCLVLLTQGSTKVFKQIHHQSSSSSTPSSTNHSNLNPINKNQPNQNLIPIINSSKTKQILNVTLKPNSILISLPSPITTYKSSNFSQTQSFNLTSTNSSILILDWLTTGRKHFKPTNQFNSSILTKQKENEPKGEEWEFDHFNSINSFYLNHQLLLKDSLSLNPSQLSSDPNLPTPQPFSIFATIYLITSSTPSHQALHLLHHHFQSLQSQSKLKHIPHTSSNPTLTTKHPDLIWSYTTIKPDFMAEHLELNDEMKIGLIKLIGNDLIAIHEWISKNLSSIQDLIGLDIYQNAFQ